uniref:Ionotropic glutamate receptor C-terminal domain-containing protein n=1 Tax=Timema bartmani TaxID=61472 RepID=A0A7R9HWQ8_9NEOP|nr:unnamed protein product [Timema bartmani]
MYGSGKSLKREVVQAIKKVSDLTFPIWYRPENELLENNLYFGCERPLNIIELKEETDTINILKQVSKTKRFCSPVWLLILRKRLDLSYLSDINIPVNCLVLISTVMPKGMELSEVYRLSEEHNFKVNRVFSWSPPNWVHDLHQPLGRTLESRRDLESLRLRGVSIHNPPSVTLDWFNGNVSVGGFVGEVWEILEESLKFSTDITIVDGFGFCSSNGTWLGQNGPAQTREADVVLMILKMTTSRMTCVDFTTSWLKVSFKIFIRKPESGAMNWSRIFSPFEPRLWGLILFTVLLTGLTLEMLNQWNFLRTHDMREKLTTRLLRCFREILVALAVIICQQANERSSGPVKSRFVFFLSHITGMVVLAAYSAKVVSLITIRLFQMPFTSLQGLYENEDYELGMIGGTDLHRMFYTAEAGLLKSVYDHHMEHDMSKYSKNINDGLEVLCGKENYAFLEATEFILPLTQQMNCSIISIPEVFAKNSFGLLFKKNSPYRQFINYKFLLLQEWGLLSRIKMKTLPLTLEIPHEEWSAVGLWEMAPILYFYMFGVLASMTIMGLECSLNRA